MLDQQKRYGEDGATMRNALVTGSTSGIGAATARALAAEGDRVVVSGRDQRRGEAVVRTIRSAGGDAVFVPAALSDAASARRLAADAQAALGGHVDVLVNNAGGSDYGATADITEDRFDAQFALNVKVPYFLTAALAPGMAERGDGAIVNVTTMVATIGVAGAGVYGAAKAALTLLTRSWAAEYGPSGVRVNAVSPGPTRTEAAARMGDERFEQLARTTPAGRGGTPEEVAAAITYLASPRAAYTNGVVLPVDGGRLAV